MKRSGKIKEIQGNKVEDKKGQSRKINMNTYFIQKRRGNGKKPRVLKDS